MSSIPLVYSFYRFIVNKYTVTFRNFSDLSHLTQSFSVFYQIMNDFYTQTTLIGKILSPD